MSSFDPIMNDEDLFKYESFLNDIKNGEKSQNEVSVFDKLIGKRIGVKVLTNNCIHSYFGVLKTSESEYLELMQKDGRKVLVLKPEAIISVTILR